MTDYIKRSEYDAAIGRIVARFGSRNAASEAIRIFDNAVTVRPDDDPVFKPAPVTPQRADRSPAVRALAAQLIAQGQSVEQAERNARRSVAYQNGEVYEATQADIDSMTTAEVKQYIAEGGVMPETPFEDAKAWHEAEDRRLFEANQFGDGASIVPTRERLISMAERASNPEQAALYREAAAYTPPNPISGWDLMDGIDGGDAESDVGRANNTRRRARAHARAAAVQRNRDRIAPVEVKCHRRLDRRGHERATAKGVL